MHDGGGQGLEETRVVAPRRESFQRRHELVLVVGRFLEIENGVVQVFFTGEVAEQDRFADSGGRGDVLGLGAAESLLRKALDGGFEELAAAILAMHTVFGRGGGRHCEYLLAYRTCVLLAIGRVRYGCASQKSADFSLRPWAGVDIIGTTMEATL